MLLNPRAMHCRTRGAASLTKSKEMPFSTIIISSAAFGEMPGWNLLVVDILLGV